MLTWRVLGYLKGFLQVLGGIKKGEGEFAFPSTYVSQGSSPLSERCAHAARWERCGFGHSVSQVKTVAGSQGLLVASPPRPPESPHFLAWASVLPRRPCPALANQTRGTPGFSGGCGYWSWPAETHGWKSVPVYLSHPEQEV